MQNLAKVFTPKGTLSHFSNFFRKEKTAHTYILFDKYMSTGWKMKGKVTK